MKTITPIPAKKVIKKTNLFIKNVSEEAKEKFQKKAKSLGYLPREYFELIVKSL